MASEALTPALSETLAIFDDAGAPLTANEVSDRLEVGRRGAYARLERLAEHDRLETKKVGANGRVWWRSTTGDSTPQPDQPEFDSLVDAVEEYAIFMLDPDGIVQTWNTGAKRIKGYEAEDIIGEHFSTFYTGEDRAAKVPERNLEKAAQHGTVEDEGWRVRKDGLRFWANVTITAIQDGGTLTGFTKVTRDMNDRHEYEEQLLHERDLIEGIFETVPVGVGVITDEGEMIRTNQWVRDILDRPDEGAVTVDDLDLYDADGSWVPPEERPHAHVIETGADVRWECQLEPSSGERRWLSINAAPLDGLGDEIDRVVFAVEDITKQKKQARRLERQRDDLEAELDEIFQRIDDAFFALDTDWRFTHVNDQAAELVRLSPGELFGELVWDVLPELAEGPVREAAERAMEVQEPFETELYSDLLGIWVEIRGYPSETGLSVYARDITERKERERTLERYETIFETISDGVYAADDQYRFTLVNEGYAEMTGYAREDLLGSHISKVVDDDVVEVGEDYRERLRDGEAETGSVEIEIETADGDHRVVESRFALAPADRESWGTVGVIRDITERKERERELELYDTIVSTMNDGVYVLDDEFCFEQVNEAYVEMTGYGREELLGTHCSIVVDDEVTAESARQVEEILDDNAGGGTLEADLHRADGTRLRAESNFTAISSETDDATRKIGVVRDVSDRVAREQELERQREHLAALNSLSAVVRDITDAVIDQSTREEIESIVCRRLADAESYEFAWIAEVDPHSQTINPRIEAGVDGYLEAIPITTAPDDPMGQGPGGRAIRTREMRVSQDALTDPDFEPWREYAEEYGYRSSAAIPIVHEDTLYGLLGVYANRPDAFGGEERDVISQLGDIIGHTIASIERKQALMSDEVIELGFTAPNVLGAIGVEREMEGVISFEQTVHIGGETFLQYGTVDAEAVDLLETVAERHPSVEELTIDDPTSEPIRFQLRTTEPPVVSVVAAHGGYVQNATIQDGVLKLSVHLPPTVPTRRIIDAIEETYSGISLVTKRQITRDEPSTQVHRTLTEDLTDRQRAALEAAVFSGYFDWPRDGSGVDIADALGVSPPTFHQHLRKAQKKLFETLYPATASA